jgi:tetratricopeptide (TPR) repeat protein
MTRLALPTIQLLLALALCTGCATSSGPLGETADDAYAAGQRSEAAGQLEDAARAYETAVERNPQFVPVRLSLAYLYHRMERPVDALEAAVATVQLDPGLAGGQELVAELSVELGDFRRAEKSATKALALEPGRLGALLQLARSYEGLNQQEDALGTYRLLLERDPEHKAGRLAYADVLRRLGRGRKAIEQLRLCVLAHPKDLEPRVRLGRAYLDEGAFDLAVDVLEGATALSDTSSEARLLLGRAYLMRGQDPLAIIELQKAVELTPEMAEAYVALGEAEFRRGYMDRALDYVGKALKHDPKEVSAYLLEARVKERNGDDAGAVQSLRAGVKAVPSAWPASRALAQKLEATGRVPEAVEVLAPFTSTEWTRRDAALYLAELTQKGAAPGPAIDALNRIHLAQPEDVEVLHHLVRLAIGNPAVGGVLPGDLVTRAQALHDEADGDKVVTLIWYARALARAGEKEQAQTLLKTAAEQQPDARFDQALRDLR